MSPPLDVSESFGDPPGFIAGDNELDMFLDGTCLHCALEHAEIFGQDGETRCPAQSNYSDEDPLSADDGSVAGLDLSASPDHLHEDCFANDDIHETIDWILRSLTPAPLELVEPVQVIVVDEEESHTLRDVELQTAMDVTTLFTQTVGSPSPSTHDVEFPKVQDIGAAAAPNVEPIVAHGTTPSTAHKRESLAYCGIELPAVRTREAPAEPQITEKFANDISLDNPKGPKHPRLDEKPTTSTAGPPSTPRQPGRPRSFTLYSTPTMFSTPHRRSAILLSVPAPSSTPRRSPRNHPPPTSRIPQRSRGVKMEVDADTNNEFANFPAPQGMTKGVKLERMDVDDELPSLLVADNKAQSGHAVLSIPATPSTPRRSPRNHPPPTPCTSQKGRRMDVIQATKIRRSKRLATKSAKCKRRRRFLRKRVRSGPKMKSTIVGRFVSGGRWKCCIRGCGFVTADSRRRGAHKRVHVRARARA